MCRALDMKSPQSLRLSASGLRGRAARRRNEESSTRRWRQVQAQMDWTNQPDMTHRAKQIVYVVGLRLPFRASHNVSSFGCPMPVNGNYYYWRWQ